MRCVLVNDANLKAETYCTHCRKKIGDSYAREIGSRFIYCDFECYRGAAELQPLTPSRGLPNTWKLGS